MIVDEEFASVCPRHASIGGADKILRVIRINRIDGLAFMRGPDDADPDIGTVALQKEDRAANASRSIDNLPRRNRLADRNRAALACKRALVLLAECLGEAALNDLHR